MSRQRVYRKLPEEIKAILLMSEGWLVGSSVRSMIEGEDVNDYDIIVPSRELYQNTIKVLSTACELRVNSFGGNKAVTDNLSLDIWCEELDHFLKNASKIDYIYNMKKNILLQINE